MNVEICIEAVAGDPLARSVAAACAGGASTIELCAEMALDGTTPGEEAMARAREAIDGEKRLMVMIRPRGGDFRYDAAELDTMLRQIATARGAGADGVVLGALLGDRLGDRLDLDAMSRLIDAARSGSLMVTLHRAFDAVADRERALEDAVRLGVDRVLTSGTRWGDGLGALQGIEGLRDAIARAAGRVEIVIGGGVSPANAAELVRALPATGGRVSLHAYSSVLRDGVVSADAVRELARAASTAELSLSR